MPQFIPPVINGTKGAFLQPSTIGRDESGEFVILTFQGTKAEVLALVPGILDSGGLYTVTDSFGGAAVRLEARFPFHVGAIEEPVNDWEFFASEEQIELLAFDNAAINGISEEEQTIIHNALDNPPEDGTQPSFANPNSKIIYQLMKKGVRSAAVEIPTIRHTQTVSSLWPIKAGQTNVNAIYSTTTLIEVEAIPTAVLFEFPEGTSNKPGLAFGWRKKSPTVRVAPWKRYQIQQEFIYGQWPIIVYGNPL